MRDFETCTHYWKVKSGWTDGHAMAECPHCFSFCVVDRDGVGPCRHSMGQRVGQQRFFKEPPLDKEFPTPQEWLEHPQPCYCEDCNPYRNSHPKTCQCYHCFNGSEQYERR